MEKKHLTEDQQEVIYSLGDRCDSMLENLYEERISLTEAIREMEKHLAELKGLQNEINKGVSV